MPQMSEVQEEEEGGDGRSNFMVGLSLSQPLEIAKQFTIIQSINLWRAGETQCPWFHDEALCIPDETTRGSNSFSGPNKEDRKDNKRKERVVEEEKDQKACLEEDNEYVWEKLLLEEAYRLRVKDGREVLQWLHCPQYLTFFFQVKRRLTGEALWAQEAGVISISWQGANVHAIYCMTASHISINPWHRAQSREGRAEGAREAEGDWKKKKERKDKRRVNCKQGCKKKLN